MGMHQVIRQLRQATMADRARSGQKKRKKFHLNLEPLEDRTVPANLFVDFGDGFIDGTLGVTNEQMQDPGINGPSNYSDAQSKDGKSGGPLFEKGYQLISTLQTIQKYKIDYNGDGLFDAKDNEKLELTVLGNLRRKYAPFNVDVYKTQVSTVDQVKQYLALDNSHDAFIFACGAKPVGLEDGTIGFAPIDPGNSLDNTAFAWTDSIINGTQGIPPDAEGLATAIAHEAGHTFGLDHTDVNNSIVNGDVMATGLDSSTFAYFTRYPLPQDPNVGTGTQNSYAVLVEDAASIGARPNAPDYVTGTGVHDRITITRTGANTASVVVEPFKTGPIGHHGDGAQLVVRYGIDTRNGVVVEAGAGNDLIIVDGSLGHNVWVRGGNGTDTVQVNAPTGQSTLTSSEFTAGATRIFYDDFAGTENLIVKGRNGTNLRIKSTKGNVSVTGTASAVTLGDGLTNAINGTISLDNTGGRTAVTVDDSADVTGRTIAVDGHSIYGFGPWALDYTPKFVLSLAIKAGTNDDTIFVGHLGLDGDLVSLPDTISVSGGGGSDRLVVNGQESKNSAFTITRQAVERFTLGQFRGQPTRVRTNSIAYDGIEGLEIRGGFNDSTSFLVQSTAASAPVSLIGGSADDIFAIGNKTNSLAGMGFRTTIDGAGGSDRLTIDDRGSTAGTDTLRNFAVFDNDVVWHLKTRRGASSFDQIDHFDYRAIEDIQILGNDRPTTFNVLSTLTGTPVGIQGGADVDTFRVGDAAHPLDGIRSTVTLDGNGSKDPLFLDDSATAVSQDYYLDAGRFDRGPDPLALPTLARFARLGEITLNVGHGGSTVGIAGTSASSPVIVNGGDGGSDQFGVDTSFDTILGQVTFHGQAADNDFGTYSDYQSAASHTYTLQADQVRRDNKAQLNYDGLVQMVLATSSVGGNNVNVPSVALGTLANLSVNNGDTVVVGKKLSFIQGSLIVASVTPLDQVDLILDDSATTASRRAYFSGPPAGGTSPYSSVQGLAAADINWLLGASSTVSVLGGRGDDAFVVRGVLPDVILSLDGGDGRDLLIAGGSQAFLDGGRGEDILIGGTTDYDNDPAAIDAIMAEWTRTDIDYDHRVLNLKAGAGVPVLAASTVLSNGKANRLTGSRLGETEQDWFFASLDSELLDRAANEEFTRV